MKSFESSKWYIKVCRYRWYIYAIYLYLKTNLNIDVILQYILDEGSLSDKNKNKLKISWKEIKAHVELSKMYKFSTKITYEREE